MKLLMAKDGRRAAPAGVGSEGELDAKLAHELADCLWSVLVLAEASGVDLERAFIEMVTEVGAKLEEADGDAGAGGAGR